jgi:hypothetical protein
MQSLGAGVFVTVQGLDGTGAKIQHVNRIRALIADADTDEQLASVNRFIAASGLTPSIVVASGGLTASGAEKLQFYWRIDDCLVTQFRELQLLLLSRAGTDPAVKDLARVFRLPGFWHQKREPRLSHIVALSDSNYDCHNFERCVQAQPQVCDPGPARLGTRGGGSRGPRARLGQHGCGQTQPRDSANTTARLHELLDGFGGLITPSVHALLREAQAPGEGTAGNRHATLVSIVAWLVRMRWGDNDIRELVLPVTNDEWSDGDWGEHLDQVIAWVRAREAKRDFGTPLPPRPDWLAAAPATGGAATRLSPEQVARVTAAFRSNTTGGPA